MTHEENLSEVYVDAYDYVEIVCHKVHDILNIIHEYSQ